MPFDPSNRVRKKPPPAVPLRSRHTARRHRRSIRLAGFDYSPPGGYFVTISTHRRECLFGEIIDGRMRSNDWGEIAQAEWLKTKNIRPEIELDEFIIMPNHMHGIIFIVDHSTPDGYDHGRLHSAADGMENAGAHGRAPLRRTSRSLGSLIAGYKSAVTTRVNQLRGTPGAPVWQRNYYEHIIRNEQELSKIREYIRGNPSQWTPPHRGI